MNYFVPELSVNSQLFATEEAKAQKMAWDIEDILEANGINLSYQKSIVSPISTRIHFIFKGYDWNTNNIKKIEANLQNFEAMIGRSIELSTVPNEKGVYLSLANFDRPKIPLGNVIKIARETGRLKSPTQICFGLNSFNEPAMVDVTEAPHILIAGQTRSGKTVLLKSIITSVLCNAIINDVKFSLIDPKRTGLNLFDECKHFLYQDTAYDNYSAMKNLRDLRREMNARNLLFQREGVVDIQEYNEKVAHPRGETMPYIFVVIDELAELIKHSKKEMEGIIGSIASLGRSTGIHLITATQKPDATQLSTSIRSNLGYRIGLRTDSSRMIIGRAGCEKLIGYGDGYYNDLDRFNYERFQTAFIDVSEIKEAINKIEGQF